MIGSERVLTTLLIVLTGCSMRLRAHCATATASDPSIFTALRLPGMHSSAEVRSVRGVQSATRGGREVAFRRYMHSCKGAQVEMEGGLGAHINSLYVIQPSIHLPAPSACGAGRKVARAGVNGAAASTLIAAAGGIGGTAAAATASGGPRIGNFRGQFSCTENPSSQLRRARPRLLHSKQAIEPRPHAATCPPTQHAKSPSLRRPRDTDKG
jgi:hypothetical protein